jgi:hypothetical protein
MGATIYVQVTGELVGKFLQVLEHEADVFVIDRVRSQLYYQHEVEIMVLRSDKFPPEWDREEIRAMVTQKHQRAKPKLEFCRA